MTDQESLLAAIHEEVRLHPYDAEWPDHFLAERDRLLNAFPNAFLELQHIGSTAIPGLPAKPIIDMLAGVESMVVADEMVTPICSAGYTTSTDFNASLVDRRWFMRWANGHRTHHLHVVVHGSRTWLEHLRFRDELRLSPALAARYAALKFELAAKHTADREAYTDAKAKFVQSVLQDA
jgi:GrpB-like predicted nucleotidyltransferase (UPF0157 family)